MLHGVGVRVPSPALKTSIALVIEVFFKLIHGLFKTSIHSFLYHLHCSGRYGSSLLGDNKSVVYKFIYSLDMREEMIRGKEAFGGCLFTGCACFFIGTILLVIFVFRDMIF